MKTSKEDIRTIFKQMENEAGWYPEKNDMLWGYFFTDKSKDKLANVATKLQNDGYHIVEIRKDEKDNYCWLHVEKVEKHSVDSLNERNLILNNLAKANNLQSYDGWDVGPLKNGQKER